MHLLSSPSPSNPNFTVFSSTSQNSNNHHSKFAFKIPTLPLHSPPYALSAPPRCSPQNSSAPVLDQTPLPTSDSSNGAVSNDQSQNNAVLPEAESSKRVLMVRGPAMDVSGDGEDGEEAPTALDAGLAELAKKMPIFEPEQTAESVVKEKPLSVNLDLALYRAKILTRNFRYAEAEYLKSVYIIGLKLCQLFRQATECNPKSCASWLAWAQLEMQQENNRAAGQLFEKAIQARPKNRFAWPVWEMFEASIGNVDKARKLLKIGHTVNPRDPVLLQSLALLEYKNSTANLARQLFRRASE